MKTARPLFAPQGRVVVVVMAEDPDVSSVQWLFSTVCIPTIVAAFRKARQTTFLIKLNAQHCLVSG